MSLTNIMLELDELDVQAVREAVRKRLSWADAAGGPFPQPSCRSDTMGAAVAEICRGWLVMIESAKEPRR